MWPCSLRSAYELQAHWSRFLRTNRPSVYIQNTFQTFSLFILCDGEDSRPCPFGGRPCKLSRFVLFPDPLSSVSPPLSHLGSFSSSGSSSSCSCADCSASPLRPREAPCPGPSLPPSLIRQPLAPSSSAGLPHHLLLAPFVLPWAFSVTLPEVLFPSVSVMRHCWRTPQPCSQGPRKRGLSGSQTLLLAFHNP